MREKQTSQHLADVASIPYWVPADRDELMHKLSRCEGSASSQYRSSQTVQVNVFLSGDAKTQVETREDGNIGKPLDVFCGVDCEFTGMCSALCSNAKRR